jgi:uncharacterized protein (DUF305 family)
VEARVKKRWIMLGTLVLIVTALVVPQVSAQGPSNRTERAEVRFLEGMIDHHQMALDMAHDCLMKASTAPVVELCQNVITAQSREIEIMRGYLLVWYGVEYHPMSMMMMQGGMMSGGMMSGGMMGGGMMQGGMMSGGMMGGQSGSMDATQDSQHDQHHPEQGSGTPTPDTMQGMDMQGMNMGTATPAPGGMMQGGMMQGGMMAGGDPAGMMGMMSSLGALTGVDYEIAWLEAMIDHHDDALHMSERILKVTERPELQTLAQGILDAQTAEIAQMETMITDLSGS